MSEPIRINGWVSIPRSELSVRFSRSSGPGGQGVNTTDSRVELTFDLVHSQSVSQHFRDRAIQRLGSKLVDGTLTAVASEHRSQRQNRQAAEKRLVETLTKAFAPPPAPRRKTKPSRSSVQKRITAKKRRGETKRLRGNPDG
ncbi:MAG: alternative ribosome rescue aminoacyl-tRNA hydrolase ArfB [Solirubrobacterales bacterium]|nr:alternative ribosome rescue aminoacyl-tRNA hydrolase ArfB [Solirubrobacterales bacterium]